MSIEYQINNLAKDEYEIVISGQIGSEDNKGKNIASAIRSLNEMKAKKIIVRINSIGGSVYDGYDIVDALMNSDAVVETIVTGLAASTAGWIAASGTDGNRTIVDYGKGMLHNPMIRGKRVAEIEDEKARESIMQIKDSISTILSNRSKLDKEAINTMMDEETWVNAEDWVRYGFADKVISTRTKPSFEENMSMMEFMNVCATNQVEVDTDEGNQESKSDDKSDSNSKTKILKMENLAKFFNLKSDASEESILNSVEKISNELTDAKTEIENLKSEAKAKDEKINELEGKVEVHENEAIAYAVDSAIKDGKYKEEDRDSLIENVKTMGIDTFNEIVSKMVIPHVDVADNIVSEKDSKEKAKDKSDKGDNRLAEEYQELAENDTEKLRKMELQEPEKFEKMYNAWCNWDKTE